MTKTTGQWIVEEWHKDYIVRDSPNARVALAKGIDQALETANAEVELLRETLQLIAGNGSTDENAKQMATFAREALAKKE